MRLHGIMAMVVLAMALVRPDAASAQVPGVGKPAETPYVATPEPVVAAMLKLANVTRTDIVYDLGSGDGRIVITAAREFGARGMGIEIDPALVTEARENARRARVTERVRFVQQDLFEVDISEATVVTLYLLPDVNLRLRPKLLRELRPGTRIVSHRYDLGDWPPVKTVRVSVDGVHHWVYYWVVPSRSMGRE
jgi:SAM-dependent methyltransferase